MSALPHRRLVRAIVISSILIPLVSFSQVRIKEKVEINPMSQENTTGKAHSSSRVASSAYLVMFCEPTELFVTDLDSSHIGYSLMRDIITEDGIEIHESALPQPPWGAYQITVRVDSKGDYVFLSYQDFDIQYDYETDGYSRIPGRYDAGRELTVPFGKDFYFMDEQLSVSTGVNLVYDDSKGTFDGSTDTVYVTVTGFGQSKTIPVVLTKELTCARVAFNPTNLSVGETATLEFTKEDGSAFAADAKFDVMIVGGGSNPGALQSSSGSGSFLLKTQSPVSYVAPATIEGDSLVVQVAVYAYNPVGGGGGGNGGNEPLTSRTVMPALKNKPGRASTQSATSISNRASLERIGRLLAGNSCSAGQTTVKNKRVPTSITLEVTPTEVINVGQAVLKVTLGDGKGKIEPGQTDAKIDFKVGQQANGFAVFKSNGGAQGLTLNGVEYALASNGSVTLELDGTRYVGRFPLGIDVSARTSIVAKSATQAVYLRGPNTRGKRTLQTDGNWDTLTYDKSAKKIGDKGCALTCIVMVLAGFGVDVDPARLNTWMNDSNGYSSTHDVKWSTIGRYTGSSVKDEIPEGGGLTYDETTMSWWSFNPLPSMTRMDNVLTAGSVAIAQVWNPSTKNAHWVLVTGKTTAGDYTILDPGGYNRVTLSTSYETIYRYVPIRPN
ncbi:MAG: hypothetical protein HW389_2685 [Bacteroidetes bacterium]|nr:hypothetical protein [Bacteroidota bacterium]